MKRAALWILAGLLGAGCPTTNVLLGDDVRDGVSPTGNSGGAGGDGSAGIAGGCAGLTGDAAGTTAGDCGGVGGGPPCEPSDAALRECEPYLQASELYAYNACLNARNGTGDNAALQCDGYRPCSYQHEGCLHYYSGGAAGSPSVCSGEPGSAEWLVDCGGLGYYGPDITAGAGGAAGSAGVAGSTAGTGAGGEAGAIGGAGGSFAGAGGEAGMAAGFGGAGTGEAGTGEAGTGEAGAGEAGAGGSFAGAGAGEAGATAGEGG